MSSAATTSLAGTLPGFPRLLGRVWSATDPATRRDRRCDALDRSTPHQLLKTVRGDYWVCAETGQMSRDEVLENQAGRYDNTWEEKIARRSETDVDPREHRRWLARVGAYRRNGRLLEVGCGLGLFIKAARAAGWQADANELSPVAARYATETAGVNVIIGAMENAAIETGVYDVILCNNVFEHLRRPRYVLGKLAAALRPGGVMFFQTLSAQSLSLWCRPTDWLYYGEGHLFIPTLVSLVRYFEATELKPIRFEAHGFHSGAGRSSDAPLHRRVMDKCLAHVAGLLRRGHRVKYLLQRPG